MRIKVLLGIFLVAGAAFLASGCGSSNKTGQGPAGIASATVCLDLNDNYVCDEGEPATQTDETGSYSLKAMNTKSSDLKSHRLIWTTDEDTSVSATSALLGKRYTLVSVIGSPEEISVFTTMLSVQSTVDEAALKTELDITEEASLLGGYTPDGQIAAFIHYLTEYYADLYEAGYRADLGPSEIIAQVTGIMLENPQSLSDYVVHMLNSGPLPPSNSASEASTDVDQAMFENIPVTTLMRPGIGLSEVSLSPLQNASCLSKPYSDLKMLYSICENKSTTNLTLIKTEEDLKKALNISGSLGLSVSLVKGSLEGKYIDEFKKNDKSVFVLIKAEYILCGYNVDDQTMSESYRKMLFTDYQTFRENCGDRFLSNITTGASYMGLLQIHSDSAKTQREIYAKLNGSYGGAPGALEIKIKGDFSSVITNVASNYTVSISIGTRGISPGRIGANIPDTPVVDLPTFQKNANAFVNAMGTNKDNPCYVKETAWQDCAYTATFAKYTSATQSLSQPVSYYLPFLHKLVKLKSDYNELIKAVTDIISSPILYDLASYEGFTDLSGNKTVWDGKSRDKTQPIIKMKAEIQIIFDRIDDAHVACLKNYEMCNNEGNAIPKDINNIPSTTYYTRKFPKLKGIEFPKDCLEIQASNRAPADKEYRIYLNGDINKYLDVYCKNMGGEPETYLLLQNYSTSPNYPSYNYAINRNGPATNPMATKTYTKLKINVNYSSVEILPDQSSETLTAYPGGFTDTAPMLGTAIDCYASQPAISNINLDGEDMVLRFHDSVTFTVLGDPASTYKWVSTPMNWEDANAEAQRMGGWLVEINSLDEFNLLLNDLKTKHGTVNAWVGLKRLDKAYSVQYAQLRWVHGGTSLNEKEVIDYFVKGEPNNGGGSEDCVHFYGSPYGGRLNDLNCSTKMPFYVEFPAQPAGKAVISNNRKIVDLSVKSGSVGSCARIAPTGPMLLIYEE